MHSDKVVAEFRGFLKGADIAFILAGLGGHTGTWAAAVACYVASSMGLLTLPMVTIPLRMEGHHRHEVAMEGLPIIMNHADLTTTFANDRLMKLLRDVPMAKAFQAMSRILATAIITLGTAFSHSDVALLGDYFGHRKEGRLGMGQGTGHHAPFQAVEEAFESPWFDIPLDKVQKGVAVIEGAEAESQAERDVMKYVGLRLSTADILYTTTPGRPDRLRVTLLLAL
jgi:cell division protein FtsZ